MQIVNAVRPTLGPLPRTVAIDRPTKGLSPEVLDSGATIARRITEIADRHADPGAMYLRGLLWRIHEEVGDGTATAAVIFDAIYREGLRALAAGVPAQRLRAHLERGANTIAAEIERQAAPVADSDTLAALARSMMHDAELAGLVAEAVDIAGAYGQIDLRDAHGTASRYELVEGSFWESGLLSDALLDQAPNRRLDLTEAIVLLTDLDLTDPAALVPVIEHAAGNETGGVLIVARSLSPAVTALLSVNSRALQLTIAVVKVPGLSGADQQVALDDLEIMTGARALRAASGDRIEAFGPDVLGRIRRGWATRTQFGIIGGYGEAKALRRHVAGLISRLDRATETEARAAILARLGKFQRGSVTLYIGAGTEAAQKLKRRAAERGINVLRRSLGAGVVPGGGAGLLHCRHALDRELGGDCLEMQWTRRILSRALETPTRVIVENAGYESPRIVNQVCSHHRFVFDASTGLVVDRSLSKVLDPVFVVRETATRAIRAAGLALTIDAIVHTNRSDISVDPE